MVEPFLFLQFFRALLEPSTFPKQAPMPLPIPG